MLAFPVDAKKTACLNESPSEKEGKSAASTIKQAQENGLNESPSEKEGKFGAEQRLVSAREKPQ